MEEEGRGTTGWWPTLHCHLVPAGNLEKSEKEKLKFGLPGCYKDICVNAQRYNLFYLTVCSFDSYLSNISTYGT